MFSFMLRFVGLWSVFVSLSMFESRVYAEEATDPYERAKYHLDGLMKSLEDIKTSHVLHKRSVTEHETDVVLSLASLCSKLDNKSTANAAATKGSIESTVRGIEKKKKESKLKVENDPISHWTKPTLFLVKVTAERDGTYVRITFDVTHESPVDVARVYSFDYYQQRIDMPRDQASVTSKVQLVADASECYLDPPGKSSIYYLFRSLDDFDSILTTIDICKFDKVYNGSRHEWGPSKGSVFSQDPPMPRFTILGDPEDELFITKGEDPVFELDMNLYSDGESHFGVYAMLWNWKTGSYERDLVEVKLSRDKTKLLDVRRMPSLFNDTLLKVDILSEVALDDTGVIIKHNGETKYKDVASRVRVTVEIGSKKMSGMIRFIYNWRKHAWNVRPVARSIVWDKQVSLKLPYKVSVFPAGEMVIEANDFHCDKTGNRGRPDYGKNCTIECNSWGSDIKGMFIVKASPYRPPVRTTSYTLGRNYGFIKQDVGPASEDNQGTYQCLAMSENGKIQQKNFRLITSLFTKVKDVSVENFSNGTVLVKCSAFGAQPLNFTVEVDDNHYKIKELIDSKTSGAPILETVENETNLTLLLETDKLRYPNNYLICRANGKHGSDSESIYLRDIIPSYYDTVIPNIKKNESSITKYGDDKTKIVCSVSGGNNLEMRILYGEPDRVRIDQKSENVRTVTETHDGKTLTLIVPTSSIPKEKHWVLCNVKNEFGLDWMQFNLHEYFSTLTE